MADIADSAPRSVRLPAIAWRPLLRWAFFFLVAAVVLAPITVVLLNGFNVGRSFGDFRFGLGNWQAAWANPQMGTALWNTATIVVTRAFLGFLIALPLAYLVARTNLPYARTLEFGFWIAFFMPNLAVAQGWIFLLEGYRGVVNQLIGQVPMLGGASVDIYSYGGIIWVHLMAQNICVVFILLVLGFRNMDSSLEEAARISGAGRWRALAQITLPLSRPMIAMIAVMGLIRGVQSYEIEAVLGTPAGIDVYSTMLVRMLSTEPPRIAEGSALSAFVLVMLVPLIVFQRMFVGRRQYTTVGSKMRVGLIDLGRWRWPAFAIVLAIVLLQTLVPFLSVVAGSLMKRWGYFHIAEPWTLDRWKAVLTNDRFLEALVNTVKLGLISGLVAAIVCFLVAHILVRTQFRGRGTLDFISWLPWAIPGVLLSLGLVTVVLGVPVLRVFYGSLFVLVIAMVLFRFPLGVQLLQSGLKQVNRELEEASTVCGAGYAATQWRINIPILLPMLVAVALMTFVTAVNEVSGVILLASTDTRTLSLLSLDYLIGTQSQPETAAVITTVMIVLCVGVALAARAFGIQLGAGSSRRGGNG